MVFFHCPHFPSPTQKESELQKVSAFISLFSVRFHLDWRPHSFCTAVSEKSFQTIHKHKLTTIWERDYKQLNSFYWFCLLFLLFFSPWPPKLISASSFFCIKRCSVCGSYGQMFKHLNDTRPLHHGMAVSAGHLVPHLHTLQHRASLWTLADLLTVSKGKRLLFSLSPVSCSVQLVITGQQKCKFI